MSTLGVNDLQKSQANQQHQQDLLVTLQEKQSQYNEIMQKNIVLSKQLKCSQHKQQQSQLLNQEELQQFNQQRAEKIQQLNQIQQVQNQNIQQQSLQPEILSELELTKFQLENDIIALQKQLLIHPQLDIQEEELITKLDELRVKEKELHKELLLKRQAATQIQQYNYIENRKHDVNFAFVLLASILFSFATIFVGIKL